MPNVRLSDVFPRDGLQVFAQQPQNARPSTADKVAIIEALDAAGVPEIEITGFAHPRVIPTLADAEDVAERVLSRPHKAIYRAVVPNLRGAERALAAGVTHVKCVITATETYERLNVNRSIGQTLAEIERISGMCDKAGANCAIGVGNSFVCPYEGVTPSAQVVRIIQRAVGCGIADITISDSVGIAWPSLIQATCSAVLDRWPDIRLGLHLHTLAGLATTNAYAAFQVGVCRFDGAVGGIGGGIAMPAGAMSRGNVATEDLVYMFESCGVATGIDLYRLVAVAETVQAWGVPGGSHVRHFGDLETFLQSNRSHLEALIASPPGDSTKGE